MPTQTLSVAAGSTVTIAGPFTLTVNVPSPPPPVLNIDDSALALSEDTALVAFPKWPIFNVQTFGAKGDGVADDTLSIRSAIKACPPTGGIVYCPLGVYAVCNQLTDVKDGPIFDISGISNIAFVGDQGTEIRGFMPGLKDPVANWDVVGNSVGRFSFFRMFPGLGVTQSNVQFRSLILNGQCPYTGNSTVGGVPATGDGWDESHKCIAMSGSGVVDNVLIFNCTLKNWKGEIVWSGGQATNHLSIVNSTIDESNASAISCSANLYFSNSTCGQNTYNGMENFCLGAPQSLAIHQSTISSHGNGIVYIGEATSTFTMDNTTVQNCYRGVLFSEMGTGVTFNNVAFKGNKNSCMITSILSLYPNNGPTGFQDFTFNNCSCDSTFIVLQDPINNTTINNLTVNGGVVFDGKPMGTGVVVNNTNIVSGGDVGFSVGFLPTKALWNGTVHPVGETGNLYSYEDRFNDGTQATTGVINPVTDWTLLTGHSNPGNYYLTIVPTGYPTGFHTTFKILGGYNWFLKADPTWNTFTADVPVVNGVTTIKFNGTLFDLVA